MKTLENTSIKYKIKKKVLFDLIWYMVLLFLLILVVTIQYLAKNDILSISNFYIPDSYTYELRLLEINSLENAALSAQAYNILNQFLYALGSHSFFVFNTSLLFLSLSLCRDVFQNISSKAINYARLSIVANPYLLVGAIGPNKETILLFLCLLFWKVFFTSKGKIRIILLAVIAAIPIFIRPVVSFPLYVSIGVYLLIKNNYNKPRRLILIFLGIYFLLNSIPFTNSLISNLSEDELTSFATSRIYYISLLLKNYSQDIILQYPAFIAKSVIFLFAPIVRPLSIFVSPLPLLDVGYSMIASLLFPFNLSLILVFLSSSKTNKRQFSVYESIIFFYTLLSIIVIIMNPILTFRYIFPFTPFIFACFEFQSIRTKNYIIYLSSITILLTIWFLSLYSIGGEVSNNEPMPDFLQWL